MEQANSDSNRQFPNRKKNKKKSGKSGHEQPNEPLTALIRNSDNNKDVSIKDLYGKSISYIAEKIQQKEDRIIYQLKNGGISKSKTDILNKAEINGIKEFISYNIKLANRQQRKIKNTARKPLIRTGYKPNKRKIDSGERKGKSIWVNIIYTRMKG